MLGVEKGLLAGELLEIVFGLFLGRRVGFMLARIGRIELAQPDLVARLDAELLAVVQGFEPPAAAFNRRAGAIVMIKCD